MASAWFGSPMTLCQSATGSWLAIKMAERSLRLDDFLRVTRDGLKEDGHLFVYTRLPAQNARTIWGYIPRDLSKRRSG